MALFHIPGICFAAKSIKVIKLEYNVLIFTIA